MHIAVGSDRYIMVSDIIRADTGEAPTSITSVTAKLIDANGSDVTGSDITLSAISGETDSYEGTIPSTASLDDGSEYDLEATVVADGLTRVKRIRVTASYE